MVSIRAWWKRILQVLVFVALAIHLSAQEGVDFRTPEYSTDTVRIGQDIKHALSLVLEAPDSARLLLLRLIKPSQASGFVRGQANVWLGLARLDALQENWRPLRLKARRAAKYFEQCNIQSGIQEAYNLIGVSYVNEAQFRTALWAYEKALRYTKESDSLYRAGLYYNLALILAGLNEDEKALMYINKALPLARNSGERKLWIYLLTAKAKRYDALKDYPASSQAMDSALYLADTFKLYREQAQVLLFQTELFLSQQQPGLAANSIKKARRLIREHAIGGRAWVLAQMFSGGSALDSGEPELAVEYLRKVLHQETVELRPTDRGYTLQQLAAAYAALGNYEEAYQTHVEFYELEDSLKAKSVALEVNEMETRYRTAEKDKEIVQSRLRLSEQQGRLIRQRSWILVIVLTAVIIISLLTSRFMYVRQKNRRLASEQEVLQLKAVMAGEEQERNRIAHDLHDGINSQLSASQSYLIALERSYPDLSGSEVFGKLKDMVKSTSLEVRQVAHNLAPDRLQQQGLFSALKEFCAHLFVESGVQVELQAFGAHERLSADFSLTVYRTAQELLQNIKKHAAATDVIVMLGCTDTELSLTIEDNGKGMAGAEASAGIGLHSLKERVAAQKGSLTIESREGGGTLVQVVFPIPEDSEPRKLR